MKKLIKRFIPGWFLSFYHFILAFFGALIYGFPSQKIKIIGVTGTNGKTTTTEIITKIFEGAEYKVALLNSVRFKIGEREEVNKLRMTMPGRFFIQRFLRKAVNSGCQYAVLEVTSEGIKQHRHRFINFDVAVFTNLSPEHIESHGTFEKYRKEKLKFFKAVKGIHIINCEDENSRYFLEIPARKKITFGLENGDFNLKKIDLKLKIPGEFNLYNALAAFSVVISQGVDENFAKKILENFEGIPGRMEEVISKPFRVFIDYAFTPSALEKVYQTLISNFEKQTSARLICVLGACGGGRDKWKRPVLGRLAARYCDEVIVTNEDPYDEDPGEIINQVAGGVGERAKKFLDRREAIKEALKLAKENDIIIITGKGCEPSIVVKDKKIPWSDKKVVKEEFERLYKKT